MEVKDKRTKYTKTFDIGDGEFETKTFSKAKHYKENGKWLEIDLNIKTGDDYFVEDNAIKTYFKEDPREKEVVQLDTDRGSLTYSPVSMRFSNGTDTELISEVQPSEVSIKENTINYLNEFPGVDDEFIVRADDVKDNLILKELPETTLTGEVYLEFVDVIKFDGSLVADGEKVEGNTKGIREIEVRNTRGQHVYTIPKLLTFEQGNMGNQIIGEYELKKDGEWYLISRVPLNWLKEAKLPVVIDPNTTIKADYNAAGVARVDSGKPNTNFYEISNYAQKVSGANHTVFLMQDGTVRTVGYNSSGQLGDGTTVDKSTPVDIGLTGVQGVAAGYYHTVFLGSNINGRRNPILSPNLFVFGGQTEGTYHGDTYNLTDFTEQTFTTTPDPRAGGLLTKFGQDLILIGGHNAAELSDVWRLNYAGDAYNPSNEEASQTTSYGFAKYRRRHGEIARHYDNIIKSTAPDTFFDAEPQLVVNDTQRALMHFNTDYFKDGSVIDKATLRLNSEGGTGTLSTLEIAPITSEWYQTATWNNMPGTGTPITVNVDPTTMGYVELDITDIVKDWNSGTPNRGIMIKKADETDTNEYVFSSMEATSGLPEFEIDYLLEGIASDDTEVDYDFYTAPENVIVRTKEVGTVLGGTSKVFELELINTNTLGTVQTELSFDGTNPDDTIELSTVTPFSPVATPYDIGPMASGEKRTVYVRVSPGNASVGDRTFYLKVAAKVSN